MDKTAFSLGVCAIKMCFLSYLGVLPFQTNLSLPYADVKPVVVMTHGDKLSPHDRAFVRMKLGQILGIPPSSQIFDICCDGDL
ncbi:hypothetical protein AXF42_Ash019565 [Apostasia shenzhenica]|uniref:Uncharacterized protein n=1 Tax=Apostasia shenzhenica TaxID=1088818 RepID=A0A2I0AV51_9ASPA|nr:hypothetical protein AXF42_Ash019565 [Apostasia shenzhenica]